VGKHYGSKV